MPHIRLTLNAVTATLAHLNTRTQKEGDADVPAADINIECNRSAEVLDAFSPTLRRDLFDEAGEKDLAGGTKLRHPELKGPHAIDGDMDGAIVKIETGIGEPMTLPGKATKFKVTPLEGGSVKLQFQFQCQPDEEQIGALYIRQKQTVDISLDPPALAAMGEAANDDEAEEAA